MYDEKGGRGNVYDVVILRERDKRTRIRVLPELALPVEKFRSSCTDYECESYRSRDPVADQFGAVHGHRETCMRGENRSRIITTLCDPRGVCFARVHAPVEPLKTPSCNIPPPTPVSRRAFLTLGIL